MTTAHTPLFRSSGALFRSLASRYPAIVGALNMCQRIMPSTRFLGSVLARHGVEQDRIRVIPYGIDIGELPPIVEVPDRFDCGSPLRIGFIGKLEAPKGPHVVLGALDHLGARAADVRVDIYAAINREDDYCSSLMTSAQKHGDAVRFAGTFPPEKIGAILRGRRSGMKAFRWCCAPA
jgi:glycosyltransferase involved in cell wall biosynthesis